MALAPRSLSEVLARVARALGFARSFSLSETLALLSRVDGRAKARRIARQFYEGLAFVGHPLMEGGEVWFFWNGPRAKRVSLSGTHTGWHTHGEPLTQIGETGLFVLKRPALPPGAQYKFVVDGRWKPDPACAFEFPDGHNGYNSSLPSAWYNRVVAHPGLYSKHLRRRKPIYIYFPPDYVGDGSVRYPVLYAKDGRENLLRGNFPAVLDDAIRSNRLPPLLVVFLPHPGKARHLEYTPFYQKSFSPSFHHFVTQELVPWVDSHLPTIAAPHGRTVLGQSYGAVSSVSLVGRFPETFRHVIAQSGTYVMGRSDLRAPLLNLPRRDLRFYVDGTSGVFEMYQNRTLTQSLRVAGFPVFHRDIPSRHEYEDWSLRLVDALRWLWFDVAPAT